MRGGRSIVYVRQPPRPELVIEFVRGWSGGHCVSMQLFRVTSHHPLNAEQLAHLRDARVLGMGQGYRVLSQHDGKENPAGNDRGVPIVHDAQGNQLPDVPPINEYSGQLITNEIAYPFYVYEVERLCDSGD